MTPEKIKQLFPRASQSTIDANRDASSPDTQSGVCHGPLATGENEKGNSRKRMVSIVSYRVRLADVEGLCGKWHLDALRMAGVIEDDTEEAISYKLSQKKVATKAEEKTLIEIF